MSERMKMEARLDFVETKSKSDCPVHVDVQDCDLQMRCNMKIARLL